MSLRTEFGATTNATIDGTTTSLTFNCDGASHMRLHAVSSTSLVCTVTVSVDGSNYINHPTDPTWSPATGDLLKLYVAGFSKVKLTRTGGSGGVSARPLFGGGNGLSAEEVMELIPQAGETGTFLESGGDVIWTSGLSFRVSAASYYILGTRYTSAETTLTLSASDPTNPRIDVIYFNTSGTAAVLEGTPAADPAEPATDPATQLYRVHVLVNAAATEPAGVATSNIHNGTDNSYWTGTASAGSIVVNSTANPRSGTKNIEITNAPAATYVEFVASAAFEITAYDALVLYIDPSSWAQSRRGIQVQFFNSTVNRGGPQTILNGTYGFNASSSSYQQVAIPLSNFGFTPGLTVDRVRLTITGGAISCSIDDMVLLDFGAIGTEPGSDVAQSEDITFSFDGSGAEISDNQYSVHQVGYRCKIIGWTLLGDQSGSIQVDVWKDTYANWPPTNADSITASATPAISTATKNTSTALTGWTTEINTGDILKVIVESCTTITQASLTLHVQRL